MQKISFIGCGNVAYRLSIALKQRGVRVGYIYSRKPEDSALLAHILNKHEYNPLDNENITHPTNSIDDLSTSSVIILAVSDASIVDVFNMLITNQNIQLNKPIIAHTSGASEMALLKSNICEYGVFYPLMTLSKVKPVDMKLVPFMIEASSSCAQKTLIELVGSLKAEYRIASSHERLKTHLAAVYVSNFINYLIGLAFDISKPNQMFLMPLTIETVRKAFLYENPQLVQTGPAIRGDIETIEKHLELLEGLPEHKEVYSLISNFISKQKNK